MLLTACSEQKSSTPYQWPVIDGFPLPQVPTDNPMTLEKITLGRYLFYDKNLSANQTQSCASCHEQAYAFGENQPTSVGSTGQQHRRNAQALVNIAYNKTLTWAHDGILSLERQILLPMFGESPVELGITGYEKEILARFHTPQYQVLFQKAFPDQEISYLLIVKSLASFVRSLISLNSPFDRYAYYGEDDVLTASELRGMNLFFSEKLECHHCHGGFNFTQSTSHEKQPLDRRPFHNTGLFNVAYDDGSAGYPLSDTGLAEISTLARDNGRFRAPTLRNIAVSAPYMHDGSIVTLSEVVDMYARGGRMVVSGEHAGDGKLNPQKSQFIRGFELTEQDKIDLIAFLHTLTDEGFLTNPAFQAPPQIQYNPY